MEGLLFIAKAIWLALAIIVGFISLCIFTLALFTWLTQSVMELIETFKGDSDETSR